MGREQSSDLSCVSEKKKNHCAKEIGQLVYRKQVHVWDEENYSLNKHFVGISGMISLVTFWSVSKGMTQFCLLSKDRKLELENTGTVSTCQYCHREKQWRGSVGNYCANASHCSCHPHVTALPPAWFVRSRLCVGVGFLRRAAVSCRFPVKNPLQHERQRV